MSMKRPRGGGHSDFEAWAGYKALPPLLGRGIGGIVLLAVRQDVKRPAESGEASLAMVVQGEPSEEELRKAEQGPLRSLRVLDASEGLHLGRLSLLEGELPAGVSEKEVRRFLAEEVGHRIIGNGQLCARAAGVRRTFLARVGLRLPGLGFRLEAPRSFRRLMQKDHDALQRRFKDGVTDAAHALSTWGGRTEHQAQLAQFDGLTLHVPPGVFVPRRSALPIVQAAHAACQGFADGRLLDCGTGSGCIALALLRRLPRVTAVAIDADPNAVACATRNAKDLNLAGRCEVHQLRFSELHDLNAAEPQRFSVAVSNPPYLPKRLMEHVGFARELQSQSVHAFAAGEDGLGAYEELAQNLPQVLRDSAVVVMGCQPGKAEWAAQPFVSRGYEALELQAECAVLR